MTTRVSHIALAVGLLLTAGCPEEDAEPADTEAAATESGGSQSVSAEEAGPIMANYANLVFANYGDAITTAQALQSALNDFAADPSAQTLQTAKDAWLASREPYGQTESFRFYDGPIDNEESGPEGQLNAWPMDESYVDYVDGMPESGIINDTSVDITKEMLASLNEVGGEENVATGYHAIEFLLWGQDLNDAGPGERSHEDYLDGGTATNADRRAQYLGVVAELLLDDLNVVAGAWDPAASGSYRESFLALAPADGIGNIMRGIGALAAAELPEERMNVALDTQSQEDEHSCFSDNTHNDILYNFLAIRNVYLGQYGGVSGPGIDTLVEARDADLAQRISDKLAEAEVDIAAIPAPFDQSISGAATDAGPMAVSAAVTSLRDLADLFVEAAASMDITLNTALE